MNKKQFDFLLQQGEGFKLEFKENFDSKNLVEKVGSGISRMKSAMVEAGLSEPEFQFTNFFTVIFKRPEITPKENTQETKQKFGQSAEKIRRKYGENTEKIFIEIASNPFVKTSEIAQKTGLAQRTVEKAIALLKQEGVLKRIGSDRSGYWEVKDGE